jgi:branched-chain amino acid transport system substrate-binding protein
MMQAGVYSAALNYIRAVAAAESKDPAAVVKQLRGMKFDDPFARNGTLRADNLMVHDMYLAQVKKPTDSTDPADVYNILATVPGAEAFPRLEDSACPMLARK